MQKCLHVKKTLTKMCLLVEMCTKMLTIFVNIFLYISKRSETDGESEELISQVWKKEKL